MTERNDSRFVCAALISIGLTAFGSPGALAQTQPPAAASSSSTAAFVPIVRNVTRVEMWDFFEPKPGGGDPEYAFIANRLLAGVRHSGSRHEITATVHYVQFGGLPDDAFGPGALGSGGNYYDHNRQRDSGELYLKSLNVLWRQALPGLNLRVGRMGYASGGEAASGDASIEALKRLRIDSRLIGEFEWSLYQRAFDGARADWSYDRLQATAVGLWPTQGGFEEHANSSLKDVRVLGLAATLKPSLVMRRTEVQGFLNEYQDKRDVAARPDNTGRPASSVDVSLVTTGGHLVGAYPGGKGRTDVLLWGAYQGGDWYDHTQRAWALALETGYQWTAAAWTPWLRGGWNRSSGDADPLDGEHETFVPPLPTSRKYSQSTAYTFMNLDDLFVHAILKPHARLSSRVDLHRLRLAEAADRWYAGSGATRREGTIFGYAGRASGGSDELGTMLEGSADWTINRRWSINGYIGRLWGGDVVHTSFARDRMVFGYVENVIQF